MSWETRTVMEQRKQFVLAATAEDANISELCRQYGISRKTGHKWINRADLGLQLCDQSRKSSVCAYNTPPGEARQSELF